MNTPTFGGFEMNRDTPDLIGAMVHAWLSRLKVEMPHHIATTLASLFNNRDCLVQLDDSATDKT